MCHRKMFASHVASPPSTPGGRYVSDSDRPWAAPPPVGGRLVHLESVKLSPAFWRSLWRPVEAADGAAGGCSSTSPLPTPREIMMPGAHTRAQCSAHVSHCFAVAFDMFMVCECRFAHASALDS